VRLTQQELNITFTRTSVVINPKAPHNKVAYNFNERVYKVNDTVDNLAINFSLEGDYVHITSA
jgi:dynein intermediate chain 1